MLITLSRREVGRIIAALRKAEEWDECDAQSMANHDGKPNRGWTREHRAARRSQAANLLLLEKLRKCLGTK